MNYDTENNESKNLFAWFVFIVTETFCFFALVALICVMGSYAGLENLIEWAYQKLNKVS